MSEVYICYSTWNQNEAAEITSLLESAEIGCRLLSRDISYARKWDDQIEKAVKGSVIAVYLEPEEPSLRVLDEISLIMSCNTRLMKFDPKAVSTAY